MTIAIHRAGHDSGDLARARVLGLAVARVQVGGVEEGLIRPGEVVSAWVALAKCLKQRHYSSALSLRRI